MINLKTMKHKVNPQRKRIKRYSPSRLDSNWNHRLLIFLNKETIAMQVSVGWVEFYSEKSSERQQTKDTLGLLLLGNDSNLKNGLTNYFLDMLQKKPPTHPTCQHW